MSVHQFVSRGYENAMKNNECIYHNASLTSDNNLITLLDDSTNIYYIF